MAISKDDILPFLRDEKRRSMGFDGDDSSGELQKSRVTALNYYNGDVSDDIPSLDNRSSAVSTDVADAIEQVLPQLMEMFLEEEVVSFAPANDDDIQAAEQETDFVNHVIFKQNDGFAILYTALKDALLLGKGYLMWQWEEGKAKHETMRLDAVSYENLMSSQPPVEVVEYQMEGDPDFPETQVHTCKIRKPAEGRVVIRAWAPDDVAVSEDTTILGDGTYCGFRSRVRRQQLLSDGYEADLVLALPSYGGTVDEPVNQARNQAGEDLQYNNGDGHNDLLETVEIYHNFLRYWDEEAGEVKLYHIVTGEDDSEIVLSLNEIDRVPAASLTPFINPHRFFGKSLADKLIPTQKNKTAILRMGLDSGYFAMNQRLEIAETGLTKHTLSDVLANRPGSPIRTKTIGSVAPVQAGSFNFPWLDALEQVSVMGEQHSGVLRASLGLTPDALHETKGGMLAQMNMGQVRIRFMGKTFAETGIKSLALGVHELLRQNATVAQTVRLRGKFVQINPASWSLREDMSVEIGNAGGREWDMTALGQILEMQTQAVELQGGSDGPAVKTKHMLNTVHKMVSRLGVKNSDLYFADPMMAEQEEAMAAQQPQGPSAEEQELQMKMQLEQAKMQNETQMAQQRFQFELQLEQAKMQQKIELEKIKMQQEFAIRREQMEAEHQMEMMKQQASHDLKVKQVTAELDLRYKVEQAEAEIKASAVEMQNERAKDVNLSGPQPGGMADA